jgi:DNA-directed RNA polymerase subunit RPC12/RpoP
MSNLNGAWPSDLEMLRANQCPDCGGRSFLVFTGRRYTRPFSFARACDCPSSVECETCKRPFNLSWQAGRLVECERAPTLEELI